MNRKTTPPPVGKDTADLVEKIHQMIDDEVKVDERVEVISLSSNEIKKFAAIRKRRSGIVVVLNGYRPESSTLTAKQKGTLTFVPKKGYDTCGDWLVKTDSVAQAASIITKHYADRKQRWQSMRRAVV